MRRVFVALAFCFCTLAMYGQKTRLGQELPLAKPGVDYPIKMHISGIRYRDEYLGSGQTGDVFYVDAIVDGKKVELRGPFQFHKFPPGDYQVRLLKESKKMEDTPFFQAYELVFPDKAVWRCTVTGISE